MQKQAKHYFDFGDFRIDVGERTLQRQGKAVALTPKAFDTLLVLVENSGRVLEKEELFKRVWPDTFVAEVTLARNISTLRQALGETAERRQYIETVPRRGYRFIAEVQEVREAEAELIRRDANSHTMGFETTPSGKHLIIERQLVSQLVTEKEEILQVHHAAKLLLPREGAGKPHWIGSKWGTVLVAVFLTASVTALVMYLWTASHARQTASGSTIHAVAVLPLKIINLEPGDEYLGIGITDRLIDDLSNLSQVVVRPTSAVLKYAAPETNAIEAGRELNVEAVLVGSVQKTGGRMRTALQLVRVRDGAALWVKNFDEEFVSLFALQDEIADQVTRAMRLEVREDERRQIASRGTANTEAYSAYMRGRFFWSKRTQEGMGKALDYFQQAVSIDPNYALAYTGLADCYALNELLPSPSSESYPKAQSAVMKALQIDDSLAEAHTSLAWIKVWFEWDWPGAEKEFKRALELNPNYMPAHNFYAVYLSYLRRDDEALVEIKRAQEIDPTSLLINTTFGALLFRARRDDEAVGQLRQTIEMDSNFSRAHLYLAMVYEVKGMYQEAVAEMQKAMALSKDDPFQIAQLASIYAMSGQRNEALKILEDLKAVQKQRGFLAGAIAVVYADLQEKDQALTWLNEAYKRHDTQLIEINGDRHWEPMISDARFHGLLQRVGFQDPR